MSGEETVKQYMRANNVHEEHMHFDRSCHSVKEAAHASREDFVKNICMLGEGLIVAVVKGEDRASTDHVSKALQIRRQRLASPQEILETTGYPAGGVPSFGFRATFLIDPNVVKRDIVYTGGGSENSLVKIAAKELKKANNGLVVRVRK